jgi:hypothetical protein
MSVRITLHCNTVRGPHACPTSLMTDAHTVGEAREAAHARGWRTTSPDGPDYCDGCSGTRRPGFVAPVVHLHPERPRR